MPVPQKSRFWQQLPKKVRRDLQRKPVTMENHSYGASGSQRHCDCQPTNYNPVVAEIAARRSAAQGDRRACLLVVCAAACCSRSMATGINLGVQVDTHMPTVCVHAAAEYNVAD